MALNDCGSIRTLLAGYLYDELPAAEKLQVEAHLAVCVSCREALTAMREASGALDAWALSPLKKAPAKRSTRRRPAAAATSRIPVLAWSAAAAVFLVALILSLFSSSSAPLPAPPQAARPTPPAPVVAPADPQKARDDAREEIARIEAERQRQRDRLRAIEREWEQLLQDKKKEAEEARRQALAKIEAERKKAEEEIDRSQDAQFKAEAKLVQAESKGTVAVIAQLEWVQGDVQFLTPAGKVPAKSAKVFVSGYGLETAGANGMAVLRFPDSTRLEILPSTIVRALSDGASGKRLEIASGSVKLDVAPQPANRPMTLKTPDAELRVVGTRFRLSTQESTRLDVHEGKVRLSRARDGASVDVGAGTTVTTNVPKMLPKPIREVAFQDGVSPVASYAGTRDAFIEEVSPTHNYGTNPVIQVDGDNPGGSGKELRMVLRWDISAIASGCKVQSASVVLHLQERAQPPYEVHAIKRAWGETEVCWQSTADHALPTLGYAMPLTPLEYAFPLNADGLALIQSWIDAPATNAGLMITAPQNSFGLRAHARETLDPSKRPKLVVTYTPR